MLEGIWYGITAAFVFIGVISSAYIIILYVFKTGNNGRFIIAVPAYADDEDIGTLLYSAHMRRALFGDCCRGKIIVLDLGMSEAQKTLCLDIMNKCGNMELLSPDELLPAVMGKEK